VRVSVETNNLAPVKFYSGSTLVYTSTAGSTHAHDFGLRTVSWKVTSTDIGYVYDRCSSAVFAASDPQ